jgi:hypothetical protein
MDFKITKNTKYSKDYGIMFHNHFREAVFRVSFGVYNWRISWRKSSK